MKKYRMKKTNALGFEMYTADLRSFKRKKFPKVNLDSAIITVLFIALVIGMGMILKESISLAQLIGEYVEMDINAQHDAYQMQQVMEALAKKRGVHPITGADMPSYWVANYRKEWVEVSAYTSDPSETDDTPTVTASGETTRDGVIACPDRYAFGTRVVIEGKEYQCLDRMHERYRDGNYFDIWMESKDDALKWGRQLLEITIKQ